MKLRSFVTALFLSAALTACSTSVPQQENAFKSKLDTISTLAAKTPMLAEQFKLKSDEFKKEFEAIMAAGGTDEEKIAKLRALNSRVSHYIGEFQPKEEKQLGNKLQQPVAQPGMQPVAQFSKLGQPGMMQPGMNQPAAQPGMMQPGMNQPVAQPGMMQPGMNQPAAQPGMMQPGMNQPVAQPGMNQPAQPVAQPGMNQPVAQPGMNQPAQPVAQPTGNIQ